jgi:hypothetical protein
MRIIVSNGHLLACFRVNTGQRRVKTKENWAKSTPENRVFLFLQEPHGPFFSTALGVCCANLDRRSGTLASALVISHFGFIKEGIPLFAANQTNGRRPLLI